MSISQVTGSGLGQSGKSGLLLIDGQTDFGTTLTLGQVIKGKVLLHYEGSRYLVGFSGREVVVDSAIPLRNQEVIHGRVVGIGEQVKLEKVLVQSGDASQSLPGSEGAPQQNAGLPIGGLIGEIFGRYRGELDAADKPILKKSVNNASNPEAMVLSGLVLSKLGVAMAPELLRALFVTIQSERSGFLHANGALMLTTTNEARPSSDLTSYDRLGKAIAQMIEGFVEAQGGPPAEKNDSSATENADEDLNSNQGDSASQFYGKDKLSDAARWLLNVQTGGTMMHRINTLPIMIDDRLVEVDIAFLQQRDSEGQRHSTKHRQVVFSLDTERMGRVGISAAIADGHVRITVTSNANDMVSHIAKHSGHLRAELMDQGWNVDELRYETRVEGGSNGVVRTVVDHIIAQDSLMRWM